MKRILAIIGVGEAAIPIINKAKEMGIFTIGFGEYNSQAKDRVDIFIDKSIYDTDGIEEICKEQGVNAVIASSEITTKSAAMIANNLGLPGNKCDSGFLAQNKYLMREKIKNITSVKQPSYFLYDGRKISSYPVMVKAIDSCGKKGITLVKNEDEFHDAFVYAKQNSSDGKVLIEEYIEGGKEYSVECLANHERKYVIQITEKVTSGPPYFTEIAHHQPAIIDCKLKHRINIVATDILNALGVTCGMAHLEIKVIDDDVYFIEVGARAGGDHIADTLTVLSTDYDYYKGAIQCSFGELVEPQVKNVAYAGIYFHCAYNEQYKPLFQKAKTANWCVKNTIVSDSFMEVKGNTEAVQSGYMIYCADHKIGLRDADSDEFEAEIINKRKDVFELIWNHNKEIGRTLSDDELKCGIEKFITHGNIIAILNENRIITFLMLYCNNYETLEAYICNVYVLDEYRGNGLSKIVLEKAIEICKEKGFKTIKLHVAEDNKAAIHLYCKYGFKVNGNIKQDKERQVEMICKLYEENQ